MISDSSAPTSPRSSTSSEEGERCRICYERAGSGEMELVRPCNCSGSMEWIHKRCLLRWLMSSPMVVSRGCDVCESPWRETLVKKPSLRLFLSDLLFGARGEIAARRFLRHISNIPRFADDAPPHDEDFFFDDAEEDDEDDLVVEEPRRDEEDEEEDGRDALAVADHRDRDHDNNNQPNNQNGENGGGIVFGLEDAWEAIGLLAPAGGGVEELNAAAAAIVRLAIWSVAMCFAVAQGRASLKLFAYGVRAVLVLDSRVDALLLPGSVADYLEVVFPGLPCLQRAARFVREERETMAPAATAARWRFGSLLRALFVSRSAPNNRPNAPPAPAPGRRGVARRVLAFLRRRRPAAAPAAPAAPANSSARVTPGLVGVAVSLVPKFFFGRADRLRPTVAAPPPAPVASPPRGGRDSSALWGLVCRVGRLTRGPWRVDDVFVGFVALALDVRGLARFARGNRLFHRQHQSLGRQVAVALARIATSPEAVAHDVATVFEHLVSSPLLVVHWLCVFPSYVYALRLALARVGLLSADERVLDLENGEGVAFHLSLLAVAASATTCVAALAHSLHSEYVDWTADHSLASLRATN